MNDECESELGAHEMRIHITAWCAGFRPSDEVARDARVCWPATPALFWFSCRANYRRGRGGSSAELPPGRETIAIGWTPRSVTNEGGIVSRHNFSCCNNCGVVEIGDVLRDATRICKARLCLLSHAGLESAAGQWTLLNYGVSFGSKAAPEVGRAIETDLQNGLTTE